MSYSTPSNGCDDSKRDNEDPRYAEWDKRSRNELITRLNIAVEKRCEATKELIPNVIRELLHNLGVSISHIEYKEYLIPKDVIDATNKSINQQIKDWKGLRWWRFTKSKKELTWPEWFKKAKCWQDQNQHKPLGKFWSLVFDSLDLYISDFTNKLYTDRQQKALSDCIFCKCIEKILKGAVRFERTRETPLLPVRALTQSKELQKKLYEIDNGFAISSWKCDIENKNKLQKQQNNNNDNKQQRSKVATIINQQCGIHATNVYQLKVQSLHQIIPSLNIDWNAIKKDDNDNVKYGYHQYDDNNNHNNHNQHNRVRSGIMMDRSRADNISSSQRMNHHQTPQIIAALSPQQMNDNHNNYNHDILPPPIRSASSFNNNNNNNRNNYGPIRGGVADHLRSENYRHSPTLSSNTDDIASLSDVLSTGSGGSRHSQRSHHSNHSNHSRSSSHSNSRSHSRLHSNNKNHRHHYRQQQQRQQQQPAYIRRHHSQSQPPKNDARMHRLEQENEQLKHELRKLKKIFTKRQNEMNQNDMNNMNNMNNNNQFYQYMMMNGWNPMMMMGAMNPMQQQFLQYMNSKQQQQQRNKSEQIPIPNVDNNYFGTLPLCTDDQQQTAILNGPTMIMDGPLSNSPLNSNRNENSTIPVPSANDPQTVIQVPVALQAIYVVLP